MDDGQKMLHFFREKSREGMVFLQYFITIPERLEIVSFAAGNPLADIFKIRLGVETLDHGGTKFILQRTVFQKLHLGTDFFQQGFCIRRIFYPADMAIVCPACFDIHGNVINGFFCNQRAQHIRVCAVGIQLYQISC